MTGTLCILPDMLSRDKWQTRIGEISWRVWKIIILLTFCKRRCVFRYNPSPVGNLEPREVLRYNQVKLCPEYINTPNTVCQQTVSISYRIDTNLQNSQIANIRQNMHTQTKHKTGYAYTNETFSQNNMAADISN